MSKYQIFGILTLMIALILSYYFGFLIVFSVAFLLLVFVGLYFGAYHLSLNIAKRSPKDGLVVGLISFTAITIFLCYILFGQWKILN